MKTILPLLFILFLFSCKKEERPYQPVQLSRDLSSNMDTIQKYLPGKWVWIEERQLTRMGYIFSTPKTQKSFEFLSLSGDTIIYFRTVGKSLVERYKIVPEKEITLWPEDEHPILATYDFVTGDLASYYRIKICKDQLVLATNYRGESPDRIYKRSN